MVECEYPEAQEFETNGFSFNRYMVECEYLFIISYAISGSVLIDTWWNVNAAGLFHCLRCFLRFNRYMVECECSFAISFMRAFMPF